MFIIYIVNYGYRKKDKLNEKNLDTESFKKELSYLRISIYSERI